MKRCCHPNALYLLAHKYMTSVVCWRNNDDILPGIWAVADSRVSSESGVLSDAVPKLFSLPVYCFEDDDFLKENPVRILNPMLAISGSTFISLNLKEVLSNYLGNLREVTFYDRLDMTPEERMPSLEEIARLAQQIATGYLRSVGTIYPRLARCEILLFGFCKRNKEFKGFLLSNSSKDPANISIQEHDFAEGQELILGDRKSQVVQEIHSARAQCKIGSLNWGRAPITALAQLLRREAITTVGGDLQLWAALPDGNKHIRISVTEQLLTPFVGMNASNQLGHIGGYSTDYSIGLTSPAADGWPSARRLSE
jgi:hypothetical protein